MQRKKTEDILLRDLIDNEAKQVVVTFNLSELMFSNATKFTFKYIKNNDNNINKVIFYINYNNTDAIELVLKIVKKYYSTKFFQNWLMDLYKNLSKSINSHIDMIMSDIKLIKIKNKITEIFPDIALLAELELPNEDIF